MKVFRRFTLLLIMCSTFVVSPIGNSNANGATIDEVRTYVRTTYDIWSGSDELLNIALGEGSTLVGGPTFLDLFGWMIKVDEVYEVIQNKDYHTAVAKAAQFAGELAIKDAIIGEALLGASAIARLGILPIEFSLYYFYESGVKTAFNNQMEFYIKARSFGYEHQWIFDRYSPDGAVAFSDDGWIVAVDGMPSIPYGAVIPAKYKPQEVYAEAKKLYDAFIGASHFIEDQTRAGDEFNRFLNLSLIVSPETPTLTRPVYFRVHPQLGSTVSYSWDFGDGSSAVSIESPDHIYANPGVYTVKLTISDKTGANRKVIMKEIVVSPPDSIPPASVSNLHVEPSKNTAILTWSNPGDADFAGVLTVRSEFPITWTPENGRAYLGDVQSGVTVAYDFRGTTTSDIGLASGQTYYYKAFAYDTSLNYASGVQSSVATQQLDGPTDTTVGNLTGSTSSSSVNLSWTASSNTEYQNYLVVRGNWSPSNDVDYNLGDNGIIYKGTGTGCGNSGLNMGTDYHYNVYTYHRYQVFDDVNNVWIMHIDYGSGVGIDLHTQLSGTLSANLTLRAADSPHIATGQVVVPEGITLTIEPGAVVKFNNSDWSANGPGIKVQGTLKAEGTVTNPIVFTSVNDNSVGGATGDGNPQPGSWDKISFESTSVNSVLRHVVVKYGGYVGGCVWGGCGEQDEGAIQIYSSSVEIANSEINSNRVGIVVGNGAAPTINACNILNNTGDGININGASPIIQASIFRQNNNGIVAVNGSVPTIDGNTFDSNTSWGVYVDATSSGAHIDNSTYTGTRPFNEIQGGTLAENTTWSNDTAYVVTGQIVVPEGITLTIEPGAVVKFNNSDYSPNGPGIKVQGTLKAEGTVTNPIVFTSVNDNSVGTATGDGNPQLGSWDKISFESMSINNIMRHVVVKYGGYYAGCPYPYCGDLDEGAVQIYSTSTVIANSEINSNKFGITVGNGATPTISACNILNNTGDGININGASPIIQASIFRQNNYGITAYNGSLPTIDGNTFDSNISFGVYVDATSSGAHINNSTYTGTRPFNEIQGGQLTANTTWSNDATYVVTGQIDVPEGITLTIEPGAMVKFNSANTEPNGPGIKVQGTMVANGTVTAPIVFTSVNDNSIGGVTGYGNPQAGSWDKISFESTSVNSLISHVVVKHGGAVCTGYYWCGWAGTDTDEGAFQIYSSSAVIANSEINYNRVGIAVGNGATPTISACNILNNEQGIQIVAASPVIEGSIFRQNNYGITAYNGSVPTIDGNTFDSNTSWGVHNGDSSSALIALNNNWGDPSGPLDESDDRATGGLYNPNGQGNPVSDHVNYFPWVGTTVSQTATPTGLSAIPGNGIIDLQWNPLSNQSLSGYRVYLGTAPGSYGAPLIVGNISSYQLTGLINGTKYYIAISSVNSLGAESVKSAEISAEPTPIATLTVSFSGTGAGSVNSNPGGIACTYPPASGTSAYGFPHNSAVTLTATPSSDSLFFGWSGACTNVTGDCTVTMNADKSVTATFNTLPPFRIPGAQTSYYETFLDAYTAAQAGSPTTIQARSVEVTENLNLNRNMPLFLKGGFDGSFTTNDGFTTLHGILTIGLGSLTVENVIVK